MKRYDFVIVGAGASGLSLACHLAASPLHDRSILLVDRSLHEHARKTWAFWEKPALERSGGAETGTPFDGVVSHTWRRLLVATPGHRLTLRTRPYRYKAIRSADFYTFAHRKLSEFPNIEFLEGEVDAVEEDEDGARIGVEGEHFHGRWVFDSRFRLPEFDPGPHYQYLKMQVQGWEIETDRPSFDRQVATFLNFRTPQPSAGSGGGLRFIYVLPYHERHALVEHVACVPAGERLMREREEEQALRNYIESTLGVTGYTILCEEQGVNPMTDYPFRRRKSRHVMSIGIAGGMLKPSTGFAFARMQRDSEAIVRSLLKYGQPFDVPRTELPYRLFEPLMLWAMARHGGMLGSLLGTLFRVGRTHKILAFLDEQGMPI